MRSGRFGHVGLRDLRLVTHADGTAYRDGDDVLLTATSAGPGHFASGHTSVWRLDPDSLALSHESDLFFRRPDRPGVYGDHASHLFRDGDTWTGRHQHLGRLRPEPRRRSGLGDARASSSAT